MTGAPATGRRRRSLLLILLLLALVAAVGAAWYYWQGQWYESTGNAYLTGNLVEVSAQIGGSVVWIGPEQNDRVEAGELILRLADGDELQALDLSREELALTVQEVLALHAQVERLEAEITLRAVTHKLAREEYLRRKNLRGRNMVSQEELDAAETRQQETWNLMETARLALQEARVTAGSADLTANARVMAAAARLRASYREWRKTRVVAPVTGEIARRRVQAGQRIQPGTPLFSLAQREGAWIEANFKENQLRNLRPGQPVAISSDLYGGDRVLRGRVASIGTGTGSVFSLLPPQNATGNWIKIVQRVPVRIELEGGFDPAHPLPFGASLEVEVDTRDRSGPRLAPAADAGPVASADVFGYQDEGADELVAEVIAEARRRFTPEAEPPP